MDNKHAFGEDSPFEYCRANNVRQIMLGTDYAHGMTLVHYAETMCNVPYRFAKSFTGEYITAQGISETRTYDYAARRLDVGTSEEFNRIGVILEEKGIARKLEFRGVISCEAYLGDAYPVICDDILHNQCRNIYDFTVSREELFEGFGGE
jgi:aminoglycoside 3-N-acetyltransferase